MRSAILLLLNFRCVTHLYFLFSIQQANAKLHQMQATSFSKCKRKNSLINCLRRIGRN